MTEVTTIGLDIAKNVFHAHGADAAGQMVFSRRLTRAKLLDFFATQPPCLVAMEACGGAHHWARQLAQFGHMVMNDHLDRIDEQIADLDREIARRAREDDAARRLMTIPGVGPVTATAILSLAPPIETFAKGRDFAAWLGLTPLQHSTGGKARLGSISKMGDRTIRRLLIIGGSSIVRQACRRGAPAGSWLESMLARKPRMLVSVALANKMARIVWALLTKHEDFKAPVAVAA